MAAETERTELGTLGEFGLIEHITKQFKTQQSSTVYAIGDDAAVIDVSPLTTVVSTDLLLEGIHFDLSYTPLKHLGYKAVVVNLSDICAMNAIPTQITFSMALSNRFSVEAVEELYEGVRLACQHYQVDLIGGDTTSSNKGLLISVTAIGKAAKEDIVYRNGACVGDILCVTGDLGSAYLGLQLLEREKQVYLADNNMQPVLEEHEFLIRRQLKPEARLDIIEILRKAQIKPTAMIDVSDGLASELFHICKSSGLGAYVEEVKLPIAKQADILAFEFRMDPTTSALNGGEDYELLFTIKEADIEKLKYLPDVAIIGEMIEAKDGIKLHTSGGQIHDLQAQGWQHFNINGDT